MESDKIEEVIADLELYLRFLCARADPRAAEVQRALKSLYEGKANGWRRHNGSRSPSQALLASGYAPRYVREYRAWAKNRLPAGNAAAAAVAPPEVISKAIHGQWRNAWCASSNPSISPGI